MGVRGGRVRKDSYKGYDARDFVNIKKYDTNKMLYLFVPNYVRQTLKKKLDKYQLENLDTYNTATFIKKQIEKLFIELERKRIDEWFRTHKKHY
jgi:hypothetical protein|tara:strand:+ start:295 stop:576 length:282 start_codon:yes stop_codon:yes gene_type:complete